MAALAVTEVRAELGGALRRELAVGERADVATAQLLDLALELMDALVGGSQLVGCAIDQGERILGAPLPARELLAELLDHGAQSLDQLRILVAGGGYQIGARHS